MNKKKKRILIILPIVVVLLLVTLGIAKCSRSGDEDFDALDSGILVQQVEERDLSQFVSATGTMESKEKTSVTSDLTYKISQLNVEPGDYVNPGDVLCVFDGAELEAQIKSLEQQLSNASSLTEKQKNINARALSEAKAEKETQLSAAQKAIDEAKGDYDSALAARDRIQAACDDCRRQQERLNARISALDPASEEAMELSQQLTELSASEASLIGQLQEAESTLSALRQALSEAQSGYDSTRKAADQQIQAAQDAIDTQNLSSEDDEARKELESLKRKRDRLTVVAEQAGIVTSLNVSNGSIHAGGELMVIQNARQLKLTVSIKESDILKLKEGMKANVTSNADEKLTAEGTITKIVDFVSSTTSSDGYDQPGYSAEITLPEDCGMLIGMSAKAKILLSDQTKAMAVAYDSIFTEGDSHYVYKAVPDQDGRYLVEKVAVTTGAEANYYTGISSPELALGDYVVSYPDMVSAGEQIEIDDTYLTYGGE